MIVSDCSCLTERLTLTVSGVLTGLICCAPVSVILGIVGIKRTKGGQRKGRGLAIAGLVLGLEDSGSRMGRLGRGLMARDEIIPIDEQLDRIRSVTADDVADVVADVFGGPRSLAIIGQVDESTLT